MITTNSPLVRGVENALRAFVVTGCVQDRGEDGVMILTQDLDVAERVARMYRDAGHDVRVHYCD